MKRTIFLAAALLSGSAATAAPPAAFLREAIQGNYSEVALGRMVQSRASSPDVRRFGAMLIRDHGASLAQAQQIARRLHLRIPARLSPDARAEQRKLQRLRGRDFDRELRRFSIDEHRKDIAAFRAQAHSGDRATSRYAAANVPVMQHHLAAAQGLGR
jgi:putative membrane protein